MVDMMTEETRSCAIVDAKAPKPTLWKCSRCNVVTHEDDLTESTSTWQQWHCECGSWEDKTPANRGTLTMEQNAERATEHLRRALNYAKAAKAPRTVARIRLAISSAKGAIRAAQYRAQREAGQ